ncbi:anti-sigma factor [Actinomyces naeslundii]|uniref:Anti-sigma factor n=1 Tax=Actinomyces naeslundii TaxID=1655 RepID=A0ABX3F0D3_ACTNA|nr:anti-sigma factor [Actinomyces naeslundii]OLO80966.1 anti-sigma factor [Actinomyces naeslundii]OLO84443.1 anti-sigma factor [Actinomyces naeslundii]OLO92049.1 anti-sigma factor [Actinomyces naeslundii]
MKDRDNTHEDAISGGADTPGTVDSDGVQGVDDADTCEALDSETAALLGSSLRPVAPPSAIRAALLEAVAREPQAGQSVGAADSDDGDDRDTDSDAGGTGGAAAGRGADSADSADSSVVPLDAHRRRHSVWRTGLMRAAAAVVLLGVGIGVGRWSARGAVDEAMDSMAPTQHYAHLNQAQDVQRVTDTMPDGHVATLTWSQDMSMTALTLPAAMKDSAGDRSLQVWLKEGQRTTSLGVYDPRDGAGFSFLDIMPRPGQQIVITMEPAGGSPQPTTPPLVTLRVSEDAEQAGTATGSPAPEPSSTPAGDSA